MKRLFLAIITTFCLISAEAKLTSVTSALEINGKNWNTGDTLVMMNGVWTNQAIVLKGTGTESQPVVLMAETPGSVILNGSSKLEMSGTYIEVTGLYFKDGTLSGFAVVSFRTSSSILAEHCRLTNTAIVNYNPPLNTVDSKWVSMYGKNNRVDHCSFENKNNSGTLLVVWLKSGTTPNHIIDNNYFGYRNANLDNQGSELNGQEIIRIGDSSTSMQEAGVTVSNNYFETCNGEAEIISNKSCGNLYSNNVFLECKGTLTLRHGNDCTVEGNYFFGNGVSDVGGVRIIGENHTVYNNYFEKLRGNGFRAALCIVRGKKDSPLNEYFQVKNALVAFNTMVDCSQAFSINYNSKSECTMPPIGTVVAHNHVYNTSSAYTNVLVVPTDSVMDVTWKNNVMNKGLYSNVAFADSQIIKGLDPVMKLTDTGINMFEPSTGSCLLNYVTSDFPEVTLDIRGRLRDTEAKLPGCSQLFGNVTRSMPEKDKVGASFFYQQGTILKKMKEQSVLNTLVRNGKMISNVSQPGQFSMFDMAGRCLLQESLNAAQTITRQAAPGIYILCFNPVNGTAIHQRILIQ